ncbi:hypothetical protein AcW1_008557 [Taiwanofungus camphoratus]|nr:hypothetical protein AcW1_008557 [Antrodia cinnamomea]KAI0956426.1 hypothetical protein AcV7_006836 [Antrodia cinnamomea]
MHRRYVLRPRAPLVVDPAACAALAPAALRRNLAAHAAVDAEIVVGGSRAEMAERLERILALRAADMAVRELLWRDAGRGGGTDSAGSAGDGGED